MKPLSLVQKLKLAMWLIKELTGDQFKVAFALLFHFHNSKTGKLYPSYAQQAREAGVSETTAKRTVKSLQELGVLDFPPNNGGCNKRNSYTLNVPSEVSHPNAKEGVTSGPSRVSPADPNGVTSGPAYNNESNQRKNIPEPDGSPAGTISDPAELERQLFQRGEEVLGKNSDSLVAKLLKTKGDDIALARAAIELASTKNDPRAYLGGCLKERPVNPQEEREEAAREELRLRMRYSEMGA
jgi:hypothetical protein